METRESRDNKLFVCMERLIAGREIGERIRDLKSMRSFQNGDVKSLRR
jgi:hypothetical protein